MTHPNFKSHVIIAFVTLIVLSILSCSKSSTYSVSLHENIPSSIKVDAGENIMELKYLDKKQVLKGRIRKIHSGNKIGIVAKINPQTTSTKNQRSAYGVEPGENYSGGGGDVEIHSFAYVTSVDGWPTSVSSYSMEAHPGNYTYFDWTKGSMVTRNVTIYNVLCYIIPGTKIIMWTADIHWNYNYYNGESFSAVTQYTASEYYIYGMGGLD